VVPFPPGRNRPSFRFYLPTCQPTDVGDVGKAASSSGDALLMWPVRTMDRAAAANAIDAFLRAIGRDAAKEPDLVGTGARVADAFVDELCAGYAIDTKALVTTHAMDADAPSIVIVRD